MFRKRRRFDVDVEPATLESPPVGAEWVLRLVADSCELLPDTSTGNRDRAEAARLRFLRQIHASTDSDEDVLDVEERIRVGRDYQEDHPIGRIDRTLDRAFVPRGLYTPGDVAEIRGVLDLLSKTRLARYATRCAARALMVDRPELAVAGLRAFAFVNVKNDPRDLMVSLAPLHLSAVAVLGNEDPLQALQALTDGDAASTIAEFSRRTDVTLEAFGWELVDTNHGRWIIWSR